MSVAERFQPEADSWIAAIHRSPDDEPFASGVVIDDRRVLTCAHVLNQAASVCVSFPKAEGDGGDVTCPVERIALPDGYGPVKDVAILVLEAPIPVGVTAAPLRCPRPADLVGRRWWAFGFPEGAPLGNTADGQVGGALGRGWVRLDTASRYPVASGFSGGGLWSPDYQAVVALVGQANDTNGDGLAITLHQADQWLPGQDLRIVAERAFLPAAGDVALSAWGWSLATDVEGRRHWRPRARGVSSDAERGYRFRGRTAALRAIVGWLDRDAVDRRLLVVTGNPGAGKSAVLGRVVTTADPGAVRQLPESDTAIRATLASVACAVHAKGLTGLEVATQIAKAASATLPERIEDFAPAIRDALTERSGAGFNVVIDALDEAASPSEARLVVSKVITLLAETSADLGAQVVVGTRRADADGDLLASFGGAAKILDLDEPEFFAEEDLAAYALATLQLAGDERVGNPYAVDAVAVPIADRIAALSDSNFLVAGLTARTHGLYDEVALDPAALSFSPKVDDAMREYLKRVPPVGDVSAETLLTALAFAESPGLPVSLWRVAVRALGDGNVPEVALLRFARSSAASFLVESSGANGAGAEFRLFHQALNDALLRRRSTVYSQVADNRAIAASLIKLGKKHSWAGVPAYLLRSLPAHASAGGLIDDLLNEDPYLLHADLRRLITASEQAVSPSGRGCLRLLHLTPWAISAVPAERAGLFSVTEAIEGLESRYSAKERSAPYRARWASAVQRTERTVLQGHGGRVRAVCAVPLPDGNTLIASGGGDRTVRLWNPATGEEHAVLRGHYAAIEGLCAIPMPDSSTLLASGDTEGIVRLWDPVTGNQHLVIRGHSGINSPFVSSLCAVSLRHDITLLATGAKRCGDATVKLWDPATGEQLGVFKKHWASVLSACTVQLPGQSILVASAGTEGVRLWDPNTGNEHVFLEVDPFREGMVDALCTVPLSDGTVLLAGGIRRSRGNHNRTIRLWDLASGKERAFAGSQYGSVEALCAVPLLDGVTLLATSDGDERTIRLWDPATGDQRATLEGHQGSVRALCTVPLPDGTILLASGSYDRTVRLWEPVVGSLRGPAQSRPPVRAVCTVPLRGTTLLASGDRTVQLRDPATGEPRTVLRGLGGIVRALCAVPLPDGTTLLASASGGRVVRLWDPDSGKRQTLLEGHSGSVNALCAVTMPDGMPVLASGDSRGAVHLWETDTGQQRAVLDVGRGSVRALCTASLPDGTPLLASGSTDRTVCLWDLATGEQRGILEGHRGSVNAVCAVSLADGSTLLASGSTDRTVCLWDLATGEQRDVLEGHHGSVRALCSVPQAGRATLLASGSTDRTVRLWAPTAAALLVSIPTHHDALALAFLGDLLTVGLNAGILAVEIGPDLGSINPLRSTLS